MGLRKKKERHLLTRDTINRENKETLNENTSVESDVKWTRNMFILLVCNFSIHV